MIKTIVSIHNGLLAEAMISMLRSSGEFEPQSAAVTNRHVDVAAECVRQGAGMVILEVSYADGTTLETRLKEVRQIRRANPDCRIVFLCDENSAPDIAREVIFAKKDGLIDEFFYASVTPRYILAALCAL